MSDEEKNAKPSSIVMRAIDASTFTEMQAFTKDLESRPIERLLRDVADLVKPSSSKAQIVAYVIATKYRYAEAAERATILERLNTAAEAQPAGEVRDRIVAIVHRIRSQER